MKLTLSSVQLRVTVLLIINVLIISLLKSQNNPVCAIGVGTEPTSASESQSASFVQEIFSPYFIKWSNLKNLKYSDDIKSGIVLSDIMKSRQFMGNNLKFRIPKGSTIHGIVLMIEGQSDFYQNIDETEIYLLGRDGEVRGDNKKNTAKLQKSWGPAKNGKDHTWMYGSATDTWGTSWTSDDINDDNFGYQIQIRNIDRQPINVAVDQISVLVYYTPAYSFCDDKCLTFYVDKYEQYGSYAWHFPAGFERVSASAKAQTLDLKITTATPGLHTICVDVYDYSGVHAGRCCRNILFEDCSGSTIDGKAWLDYNDNQLRDAGEGIIAGLGVELITYTFVTVATTITDQDGNYRFDSIPPGKYYLRVPMFPDKKLVLFNAADPDRNSDITNANGLGTTSLITVEKGKNFTHIDLGYTPLVSFGDFVWEDANFNGLQDIGEKGLPGVKVRLYTSAGVLKDSVVTDFQGMYGFINQVANSYYITFETPGGYVPTFVNSSSAVLNSKIDPTGKTPVFNLITSGFRSDIDAGYLRQASLGDQVWEDKNGDGLFNSGETGLAGVSITLTGTAGNGIPVTRTVITDIAGRYRFDGLFPGLYHLNFIPPAGYYFTRPFAGDNSIDSDVVDGFIRDISLKSGETNINLDAGLYRLGSLSNFVWEDLNANGIQDTDEPGLGDVLVRLFEVRRDTMLEVGTQITDANGYYLFDQLNPGKYELIFEILRRYQFTAADIGMDDTKDSDVLNGVIADIMLMSGEHNDTYDAGMFRYGELGDFVWEDTNGNGIQDAAENGIGGISIRLTGINAFGANVILLTETDISGYYRFSDITPGVYDITLLAPLGYEYTVSDQGNDDEIDADGINGVISGIVVTSGKRCYDFDFGLVSGTDIGDFVWDDLNADGIQNEDEPGLKGVNMMVTGVAFNGSVISKTTTTDDEGRYLFSGLLPGNYRLTIDIPTGYIQTRAMKGTDRSKDSDFSENMNIFDFTVQSNVSDLTIDAGLVRLGSIGDLVWEDLNCNGIRENGEPGVPDVRVWLDGVDLFNAIISQSTITDAEGHYLFSDVKPGQYTVTFETPAGYEFSAAMVNMADIRSGMQLLDIDAPLFRRGSLGDYVWDDLNENGVQDVGEPGIEGVLIRIKSLSNQLESETITDGDGKYFFDQLKPGSYEVRFTIPEGYIPTVKNMGSNTAVDSDIDENGIIENIVIISGQNTLNADAGFSVISRASVGDFVWEDINGNGLQDNFEPGIAGLRVTLEGVSLSGSTIFSMTNTDFFGRYFFSNLPAGNYRISFQKPDGYQFTVQSAGSEDQDSDADPISGITSDFVLGTTTQKLDMDAGMFRTAAIGDFVWNDLNGNGLQDIGEPGISGILLRLADSNGIEVATVTSGNFGFYIFSGLRPGIYTISADLPQGFILTDVITGNDALNSDFYQSGGKFITNEIFLTSNAFVADIDLGLRMNFGQISGKVWSDVSGDGIINTGEVLLEDILVYLVASSGDTLQVDTTDMNGFYIFSSLMGGDYEVKFTVDPNKLFTALKAGNDPLIDSDVLDPVSGSTGLFTLAQGEELKGLNAGYVGYSSIGDFVWVDEDGDGLQSPDEPGLNGIKIRLFDASGVLIDSTVSVFNAITSKSGYYTFSRLLYGAYMLEFLLPDNFDFTFQNGSDELLNSDVQDITSQSGKTEVVILVPGQQRNDVDAGYVLKTPVTGTISGVVWQDDNNSKLRESNEVTLSGIQVTLKSVSGQNIFVQVTSDDGSYAFTDIPFGDYYLVVPQIDDKLFVLYGGTPVPFDSDITNDFGLGSTRIITLFPGETISDIDMGYANKITIGDFVWDDLNNNGLQDTGEPGLAAVPVRLVNETGFTEKITISDINGNYVFDNVAVGKYRLSFGTLQDYIFALSNPADQQRNSKADLNTGITELFDFSIAQPYTNIDAGYVKGGKVGSRVWLDLNGNGFYQPGEPGIANIRVKLFTSSGILMDSTITVSDPSGNFTGFYQFTHVRPGSYFVKFEIPGNYIISPAFVGGEDNDSNITGANGPLTTDVFTVDVNETVGNIDAGAYIPATLGDRVWNDLNKNGTQDPGETGISGITVSLFTQTGQLLGTRITDSDGLYAFTGLRQRLYYLQFSIPEGFEFTLQNSSGSGATDSDVDETGTTPLISLAHGSTFLDVDAGMYTTNNKLVMGNIWKDINADGIRNFGESLMKDVKVYLKDKNQQTVATRITNHAGMYCFSVSDRGEYYVFVELPEDHVFSDKNAGADPNMDCDVNDNGLSDMLELNDTYRMKYIDAGYYYKVSASINGVVWKDMNNNSIRDNNDELLADVVIFVFNASRIFVKSTKTNKDGTYSIKNLDPGQYFCKIPEYPDLDFVMYTGQNPDVDSEITNQYGVGTTRLITIQTAIPLIHFDMGYRRRNGITTRDQEEFQGLEIYPNPSISQISIRIPHESNLAEYHIFNSLGAMVQSGKVNQDMPHIAIEHLPAGMYRIQVSDKKQKWMKTFLKIENY